MVLIWVVSRLCGTQSGTISSLPPSLRKSGSQRARKFVRLELTESEGAARR